jgi:thiamine biosynthesis lipoprotein
MRTLIRHTFRAMGTDCAIIVTTPIWEGANARRALLAALDEVGAQEAALSRFDTASELSALNAASGRWVRVSDRLFRAVATAEAARRDTAGRYDPTVLPAVIAAGYDASYDKLRPRDAGSIAGWSAGAAIELDPTGPRIRLAPGASVDLGGIGKGQTAALAVRAMYDAWPELPGALVDLGGDISVAGEAPDRGPWRIAVADPRNHASQLGVLVVRRGGVATSGRDRRRLGKGGIGHHLIDPSTGRPAVPGPLGVTVVAPSAGEAEAHATALAITPVSEAAAYVVARPQLAAIVVPAAGPPFTLGRPPLVGSPTVPGGVAA